MALSKQAPFFIAYSGGVDSTVLLHLMSQLVHSHSLSLTVLHANHGLQAEADSWQQHCKSVSDGLNVPFLSENLVIQAGRASEPEAGLETGLEERAREARYQWFSGVVPASSILLTAHHQGDKAETLLFHLLRGAGSRGLSSLRAKRSFGDATLVRPLLAVSKSQIIDYANKHQLTWVDDASNQDVRFSRNFLRHKIIPTLTAFRSDALAAISRTSANLEDEADVLWEVANADLQTVATKPLNPLDHSLALCLQDVTHFRAARIRNLLRVWLMQAVGVTPSRAVLIQLADWVVNPPNSTAIVQENGWQYRGYDGYLYVMPALNSDQHKQTLAEEVEWGNLDKAIKAPLTGQKWRAKLQLESHLRQFDGAKICLAYRQEQQTYHDADGIKRVDIKAWMYAQHIPPWRRFITPMLLLQNKEKTCFLGVLDREHQNPFVECIDEPTNER